MLRSLPLNRVLLSCVLALAGVFVGCAQSSSEAGKGNNVPGGDQNRDNGNIVIDDSDDNGGDDTAPDIPDPTGDDSYTFVLSQLSVGQRTSTGGAFDLAPGVNLDQTSDAKCNKDDFKSYEPDNEEGVDNQLIVMAPVVDYLLDLGEVISDSVTNGDVLLIVELSGVGDLSNDPNVTVKVYQASVPVGSTLSTAGGKLTANQAFDIDDSPLVESTGSIVGGRLEAEVTNLPLAFQALGKVLAFPIQSGVVRADVSETGMARGVLGGSVKLSELIVSLKDISGLPESTLNTLLGSFADMGQQCDSISAGLEFEGVEAITQ